MPLKRSKTLELLTPAPSCHSQAKGEPYQPFPVDVLPPPLQDFVRDGATAIGCDPACLAVPALAVVAGAVGNLRVIRLKDGMDEPCVVWSAVVGDGDPRAAAALRMALGDLLSRQKQAFQGYRIMREHFEEERNRRAPPSAINVWGLGEDSPKGPVLQWFVCGLAAVDRLAAILEDNPRGVLLAREELNGWLGSFSRRRSTGGGRDAGPWLEMHRAAPLYCERTRGDRGPCFVQRAAVSLTGLLSPGILGRVWKGDGPARALADCFLVAMPPRVLAGWSRAGLPEATERAFHELLDRLLRLEPASRGDGCVPKVLTLSTKAAAGWAAFYNAREAEEGEADGVSLGRLRAYAARLALVDHLVRGDAADAEVVGPESMAAGVKLCRWFTAEKRRVYAKVFETAEERNAAGLVELIRGRGGRITVRDLMRSYTQRYPDVASAEVALAQLVALGLGRWVEEDQKRLTA